jgi:flagellar biosynthesis protein FlhF
MRIKSYFAATVEEAMDKARRELGPEAMLMNSKKTELELRSLGSYEVVFAVPPEAAPAMEIKPASQPPRSAAPRSAASHSAMASLGSALDSVGSSPDLIRELAELRKQIETVKRSVDRRPASPANAAAALGPDGCELVARLTGADISEELALELATAIDGRRGADGAGISLEAALRAECEQRLRFSPALRASSSTPSAVLFAGPAGAGKTTTLIKLALRYGLRAKLPLQLLSLDTLRIGGWEQLAAYARIAGIPCQPVHTPAALSQAFAEYSQKKLLLIDTPGFSPADETQCRNLAASLAAHREMVEVHLVLSAAVLPRIQLAAIERFAAFAPAKLIFTHLDEVESPGPLLETALRAGLPLSFLGRGQQVPEDIDEASLDRLLGSLANRESSSHASRVASVMPASLGTPRRIASAA